MAQTGETWSLVLLYARAEIGYYLFIVAVVYCSTCLVLTVGVVEQSPYPGTLLYTKMSKRPSSLEGDRRYSFRHPFRSSESFWRGEIYGLALPSKTVPPTREAFLDPSRTPDPSRHEVCQEDKRSEANHGSEVGRR